MKYFIISNLYEPYVRGGAEAVTKTTAEGLVHRGHEVMVLTAGPRFSGLTPHEEIKNGVRVLRFFPLNIFFVRDDWRHSFPVRILMRFIDVWNFHSAYVVWRTIKRAQPDVVITTNLVGIGMLAHWVTRRCTQAHTIHVLHDIQLVHPSGLLIWGKEKHAEHSIMRRLYERLMCVLMGSPTAIISPSRWLLQLHATRGFFKKSKQMVLPNPVETELVFARNPTTCPPKLQRRWAKQSPLCLLFAGQLETHKGVRFLLDLKQKNVSIAFAGSGSLENDICVAATERPHEIIFLGKLTQKELYVKFQEVDALIVPSLCYENAPRIISEALAAELPVIASRIGGIPEMVRDGENGFLFTPGDAQSFSIAVQKIPTLKPFASTEIMITDHYLDKLEKT